MMKHLPSSVRTTLAITVILMATLVCMGLFPSISYALLKTPTGFIYPTNSYWGGEYLGWLQYNSRYNGYHLAVDFKQNTGDPVYAIADGEVVAATTQYVKGKDKGGAFVLKHRLHDGTYFTALYGHIALGKHMGDQVKAGEQIGSIANCWIGESNVPHLHFEIHPNPQVIWTPGYTSSTSDTKGCVDPLAFMTSHTPAGSNRSGCTDPAATNYNPAATVDDGSCQYPAFNEYPGIPAESLTNHYYYSWLDSSGGEKGLYTWTLIGNPSTTDTAHVIIKLAGEVVGAYTLEPGARAIPKLSARKGGPVEVISDMNIYTTQRTVINGAFSEYAGIPAESLTNHYYYSWIDASQSDHRVWTFVANPSDTDTAHVTIKIGGNIVGTYTLQPGEQVHPEFEGMLDGPVEVESDIAVLTTQRTVLDGALNEYAGIPAESLTNHYYYSWIDASQSDHKVWTFVANPSATDTAHVTIKIGGNIVGTYTLQPGEQVHPKFGGMLDGPVEVESDVAVFTTQRTAIQGNLNEYVGIPANRLSRHYYYAWMDSEGSKKRTWTLIANPSATDTAHVAVKIAGDIVETYDIEPGDQVLPRLDGLRGGPVEVESDINVVTTQRVSMKEDYVVIPTQTYYYSWIDTSQGGRRVWTFVTNPSVTDTAHVTIKIAGNIVGTYTLQPGKQVHPKFDGMLNGPVTVESDIDVVTTQRTVLDGALNEYAGIPAERLTNHYYYSWIDASQSDHKVWTFVANPSATDTAHVTIKIAGNIVGTYTLQPGEQIHPKFGGMLDGPVEVESDRAVFTTQRTLIDGMLNEYAGIPAESLTNHYYYSWIDASQSDHRVWTFVANPSATDTAHVTIKIAGNIVGTYTLQPGEQVHPEFEAILDGPVEVKSDIAVFTTQRTAIQGGFNEYAGIPAERLTNHYYYSWIDASQSDHKVWTFVANPSATDAAHVTIKIGGNIVGTYTLQPGEQVHPKFGDTLGGPVEVKSDIAVFTTQRTAIQGGFNEYAGMVGASGGGSGAVNADGGSVVSTDGMASVTFPPEAVTHWLKVKIAEAAESLVPAPNAHEARVGKAYHFTAIKAQGEPVTRFARAVTVGLRYEPDDVDPADELLFTLKFYDEGQSQWVKLPSTVDIVHAAVSASTEHFTLFAIFAPVSPEPTPVPTATPGGGSSSEDPSSPSPVPEPTTVLLFGIGLFGIFTMLLRKKRR